MNITPVKTIVTFTLIFAAFFYLALDRFYKSKLETIMTTYVATSSDLIEFNNVHGLAHRLNVVKEIEPYLKTIMVLDENYRVLYRIREEFKFTADMFQYKDREDIELTTLGLFKYGFKYKIQAEEVFYLIAIFHDPGCWLNVTVSLFFLIFFSILFFLFVRRFDLENINSQISKKCIEMLAFQMHETKGVYRKLAQVAQEIESGRIRFSNPCLSEQFLKDFTGSEIILKTSASIVLLSKMLNISACIDESATNIKLIINRCVKFAGNQKPFTVEYCHQSLVPVKEEILSTILYNLIINAFYHSSSFVWISSSENHDNLYVRIANSGRKISKKRQKTIFRAGESSEKSGSGLGLHIANLWCKRIKARIDIESNSGATVFTLILPISKYKRICRSQARSRKNISFPPSLPSIPQVKSVALIEDTDSYKESLSSHLESLGFSVISYSNPDPFFDQIKAQPDFFTHVIVDRFGDGFDAVKNTFPKSCKFYGYQGHIILCSCDLSEFTTSEYFKFGFHFAVEKGDTIDWKSIITGRKE